MLPILALIFASVTTSVDAEALSWKARNALAQKDYVHAKQFAEEVYSYAHSRDLSHDEHLQIALGAAIEVQAQILAQQGQRAEAVGYLRTQLHTYLNTPIGTRLQKNLNLIDMAGKPAPALDMKTMLGSALPNTKGKAVLLFFWAHWCSDCKAEAPLLSQLPKDLVIIAPTQHYGYTAASENVAPAEETKYIDRIRQQFYPNLPVPVSEANFKAFGASTTPTLVFIDRKGIVRLYHPGAMSAEELRMAVSHL